MKNKEEILEEIENLNKSRDSFVVETLEWKVYQFAISRLDWVLAK